MITVVIPVRNRESIVLRTLDSLASQTRKPESIVLVDNGSTDSTLRVLEEFATRHPGLVKVVSEPTPGAAEARNRGLAEVRTPYVLFFDSDDYMPPRHIEQITDGLLRAGQPEIGAFDLVHVMLDGSELSKPFRKGDPMFNHIFHTILSTQRCVLSTEFLRRAGGWPLRTPVWDDYILGVKLLSLNAVPVHIPLDEPVRTYAQVDSITGTGFSDRAGLWEAALDRCDEILRRAGLSRYCPLLDYRRAILAGTYRREGHPELASGLTPSLKMRLIARFVAAGGRGVAYLARLTSPSR